MSRKDNATTNVAEYGELIEALRWATSEGLRGVEIYSDSQLMAEIEATLS